MNECNSLEIFPWIKMFYKKDTGIIDTEITIIMFYLVGNSGIHLQTNYFWRSNFGTVWVQYQLG